MKREIQRPCLTRAFIFGLLVAGVCLPAVAESPVIQEARAFRVRAYQNFRNDRARYNELRRLDDQLTKQWQEAGKPESREAEVLAWYQAADKANATTTPELPDFSALIAERKTQTDKPRVNLTVSNKTVVPNTTSSIEVATETNNELAPAPSSSVTKSLTRAVFKAITSREL